MYRTWYHKQGKKQSLKQINFVFASSSVHLLHDDVFKLNMPLRTNVWSVYKLTGILRLYVHEIRKWKQNLFLVLPIYGDVKSINKNVSTRFRDGICLCLQQFHLSLHIVYTQGEDGSSECRKWKNFASKISKEIASQEVNLCKFHNRKSLSHLRKKINYHFDWSSRSAFSNLLAKIKKNKL